MDCRYREVGLLRYKSSQSSYDVWGTAGFTDAKAYRKHG